MRRLLPLVAALFVLNACKKEVKKVDPPSQPFTYSYTMSPAGGETALNAGDTAYINVHIALGSGPAGLISLGLNHTLPGVHTYLSQDKGLPPFDFSIMITADDTIRGLSGSASLTMNAGTLSVSDNYLLHITVYPAYIDTVTDCTAAVAGTYKFSSNPDTNHYFVSITPVAGKINKLKIANFDNLGGVATVNLFCADHSFIIPFQHLGNGRFVEGSGVLSSNGYIIFDITQAPSGDKVHHAFSVTQ